MNRFVRSKRFMSKDMDYAMSIKDSNKCCKLE